MKYGQLITLTEEIITSLNQNIMTPDSHAEQFLDKHRKLEDTERVFLKQVFYGCGRYKQFLEAFIRVLFSLYPSQVSKNDQTVFMIFTYLVCFRLSELPGHQFKKMVLSQNPVKMNVLFTLLFDSNKLREVVKPEWILCLDQDYIQEKILEPLDKAIPSLVELMGLVCEKATGKKSDLVATLQSTVGLQAIGSKKDLKKNPTVPQPFNLTRAKVKDLPEPQKIQNVYRANPAPQTKKSLKEIEDQKKKRRNQIKQNINKYYEENRKEPELQSLKRPTNLDKLKGEEESRLKEMTTKTKFSRPVPEFGEVETRLNVAAILREEKKLQQRIDEQQKRVRDLEVNMRDQTEFEGWKQKMKSKDRLEEIQQQQKKKIQVQLSRQAAIKAFQNKIESNKLMVEDMKAIHKELKAERQELEKAEFQTKKKIVEEVSEQKDNVVVERQKLVQKNKKIRDEEKQKRNRVLDQKKELEEVQLAKKRELISQIRALLRQPKNKPKILDPAQTMGYGLLEEMSLQELRARLNQVQEQRKREEEERRKEIVKGKQSAQQQLNNKRDRIMEHRKQHSKQKADERETKRKESDLLKQKQQELRLRSLNEFRQKQQQKLQKKKEETDLLNKELKELAQKREFMNENHAAVEFNAFHNIGLGADREMLERQNYKLVSKQKQQRAKQKDKSLIAESNRKQIQSKIEFNETYDKARDQSNKVYEEVQDQDKLDKANKFRQVKEFQQKHTQNMTSKCDYKSKINQMSLTQARQKLGK